MPGRLPGQRRIVKLLPADETKLNIYHLCKNACKKQRLVSACIISFCAIWDDLCPNYFIWRFKIYT